MLNEEKIRLMTDVASFEKKNGPRISAITSYFKSDYISRNLIRGFLSYTVCAMLILTLWGIFHMDLFIGAITLDELLLILKKAAFLYAAGLLLYLSLMYAVYARRYNDAVRLNRIYVAKLRHLDKRYDYQNRLRELAREGRRV